MSDRLAEEAIKEGVARAEWFPDLARWGAFTTHQEDIKVAFYLDGPDMTARAALDFFLNSIAVKEGTHG